MHIAGACDRALRSIRLRGAAALDRACGSVVRDSGPSPGSSLARTRFVFWAFSLANLVAATGMLLFLCAARPWLIGAALLGVAWIAGRDLQLQRSGRTALALVPLDALALLAVEAALGANAAGGVCFLGVFYRSLYGERRHVFANTVAYLGVYATAAFALGSGAQISPQTAFINCAGLLFSAFSMRLVAAALRREEQTRARERLLRQVGDDLVAARSCEAVYEIGLAAALPLFDGLTRARVAIWRTESDCLRAVAVAGAGADGVRGAAMPLDSVPAAGVRAMRGGTVSRFGPGTSRPDLPYPMLRGEVVMVPLRTQDASLGAMVISSDGRVPDVLEDTLLAIASQVALALESEQLTADLHRRLSEERFSALVANASDVITVLGCDLVVSYQTPSIERVLGYEPETVVGRPITDLVHPDDRPTAWAFLERARDLDGTTATGEWRVAHRAGVWRSLEVVAGTLTTPDDLRSIVLTSRDVTERKALERRLAHQAFHDSLTGLPNRDLFRDRVEHALSRARRDGAAAVLFIDVDDFKYVNDTLGHASGDRMLELIAERLQGCVRPGDTAARLGGDEFGVLLEDIHGVDVAVQAARRVLSELERPLALASRNMAVHASVGIALARDETRSADDLLRNADIAMYAAKADGKSRLAVFEPSMYAETLSRVQLRDDLAAAVGRGELCLHYQPIVDLSDRRPHGVEALVRWQHPERGLLYPGDFVSLAEESGLILPIGRFVIEEACRQLRAWRDSDRAADGLRMSVNLSPCQLVDPDVIDVVARALRRHDLEPGALVVEITESAVMEDLELAITRLDRLASLGVQLALDDFGTGYSSLSYLQRFPLHVLKLDRSFTFQLKDGAQESRLPHAIIDLAHTLGLTVVAEGVEDEHQAQRLLALGCRLAQGYRFSRPLAADAAFAYLVAAQRGEQRRARAA